MSTHRPSGESVLQVSFEKYIITNTHAHTRTRGPAAGLEPRADYIDPTRIRTQREYGTTVEAFAHRMWHDDVILVHFGFGTEV